MVCWHHRQQVTSLCVLSSHTIDCQYEHMIDVNVCDTISRFFNTADFMNNRLSAE